MAAATFVEALHRNWRRGRHKRQRTRAEVGRWRRGRGRNACADTRRDACCRVTRSIQRARFHAQPAATPPAFVRPPTRAQTVPGITRGGGRDRDDTKTCRPRGSRARELRGRSFVHKLYSADAGALNRLGRLGCPPAVAESICGRFHAAQLASDNQRIKRIKAAAHRAKRRVVTKPRKRGPFYSVVGWVVERASRQLPS